MAQVIKFSDAVNLGFHAMIELGKSPGVETHLKRIADGLKVSEAHLSKVLQRLRKMGLLKASRGPSGGYILARPPEEISMNEIFVALEGPIEARFCLFGHPVCSLKECRFGDYIGKMNLEMKNFLEKATLAEFIAGTRSIGHPPSSAPGA